NLLMTNRHVAEIFASGLGVRQLGFRTGMRAAIDFLREQGRSDQEMLEVRSIRMIHPYWDMALLEVEGLAASHVPLKLSLQDVGDLDGRRVAVIGYP
ncbi:serine protease, partial [Escherichia coli]|uniref:serine protease n=16 Tax=Pseudomonadota TaxID=1224 RepID=UPI0017AE32C8